MPFRSRDMCYRRPLIIWPEINFCKVGRFDFPVGNPDFGNVSIDQVDVYILDLLAQYKTSMVVHDMSSRKTRYRIKALQVDLPEESKIAYKITLLQSGSSGRDCRFINSFYQCDLTEDVKWADLLAIRSCYKN